jgi:Acyl-CoA reductase (LuxC)
LALDELAEVRAGTAVLTWDHELAPTELCSAACDVRLLWGGDETVAALRGVPLGPAAKDVAFVDRFSMAAIDALAWLEAGQQTREDLATRLHNDAYWFDQQGCSSPRLLVWCGEPEQAAAASDDLFGRLAARLDAAGYELPLGAVTAKLAWIAGAAIDRPLVRVRNWGNSLSVLSLASLDDFDRTHPGAGTFLEATLPGLDALAGYVTPRDQTLAVFGFGSRVLEGFVRGALGRGIDRVVPLGEALKFDHRWDGMDLLSELTRQVVISPGAALIP